MYKELDKIGNNYLIDALISDEETPWATYNRGQPLTPRQLTRLLKGYNIASKDLRFSSDTTGIKGFELKQFTDTFLRYLAPPLKIPIYPLRRYKSIIMRLIL